MPAHVSANFGAALRWVTAWESTTCIILRSATSISTATGSTHRIPVGTTCSCIAPSPEATPPERWRNSGPRRPRRCVRHDTLRTGTWLTPRRFGWLAYSTRCSTHTADSTIGSSSSRVQATIVTGGGLWAIKGQPQDPLPRRMTVALDHEWASLRPFGADDQKTAFTPERVAIEKLDGRVVSERLNPRESFDGHEFATPMGPAATCVLQRLRALDLPHHAVSADAGRRLGARDRLRSRTTGKPGQACRRSFHPKSQVTLRFKSSTSETIICCAAMTTGSTWQEGFLRSNTCPASSKPRASRCPRSAGPTAPTPKGNAIRDQLMVAIDFSDVSFEWTAVIEPSALWAGPGRCRRG